MSDTIGKVEFGTMGTGGQSSADTGLKLTNVKLTSGVWIAYYADWSGVYVFETELDALRWAVQYGAAVKWVPYGQSVMAVEQGGTDA